MPTKQEKQKVPEKIQNRYIKTGSHVRQLIAEQINILRHLQNNLSHPKHKLTNTQIIKYKIDISRAIAYLSSVALTAIRDYEMEDRIREIEELLKNE